MLNTRGFFSGIVEDSLSTGLVPSRKDLNELLDMTNLIDIRENKAYQAFIRMIGGVNNPIEHYSGYDILAKEYKRELKYIAGNLMQLHMREAIRRSVDTIVNFFKGFPTIS